MPGFLAFHRSISNYLENLWVLFSEIFPNRVRALPLALVGLFNSMSSFIVQLICPVATRPELGIGLFLIYSPPW